MLDLDLEYKTIVNSEKIYPDHKQVIVFKKPFKVALGSRQKKETKTMNVQKIAQLLKDNHSLQRTKTTIKDIIMCNTFELFCTFTFKDDGHRSDPNICMSRMQYWLQSQQKLYGSFDYIIVPEFHKEHNALHFHALFSGYKGRYTPAVYADSGNPVFTKAHNRVYNLDGWRSGFGNCTIINPDNKAKAMNYITKYITKDMPTFFGKKRFWVSQTLARPVKSTNVDILPYLLDSSADVIDSDDYTLYIVKK